MIQKLEEQVIYPKDLLFAALYRWKAMVVVGLVLAILLGGWQLSKGLNNGAADDAAQAAYKQAVAEYEEEQALLNKYVEQCQAEVDTQRAYMEESLYLSLDPYAHYRGTLRLYLSTDYQIQPDKTYQTPDIASRLLASYQAFLHSDDVVTALAETAGLEWRLLHEIYQVHYDASINTMAVIISHKDEAMLSTLLQQVQKALKDYQQELTETVGEHEIELLYQNVTLVTDTSISTAIRNNQNHLNYLQEELAKAEDAVAKLTPPAEPQATGVSLKKVVIFAVLGFVAGAAIVAVCAWFVHMESDKVYSARLLRLRTGVKLLGTLPGKNFCGVDRLLRRWEGRDASVPEEKAALLAVDIRNRCPQGKLLLTGTGTAESRCVLAEALKQAGLDVTDAGSVLKDAAAVEALKDAAAVVLAEQCGVSVCTGIYNEMQTVSDYGKTLVGCVVLDG